MATQTVDSHQTSTSDEKTEKFNSESVKVAEQINLSSPKETVEEDREKGRADNLHVPDSTLSTSKEKAVDIQVEHPVIEIKKIDETPVVNLPVHDNVQLEKEATAVSEEATVAAANETLNEERPSAEPVGGEATELPVIAYLEKSIKEFDATDNGKSPPEEQPTVKVIERETLEVPAEAAAQKVEEQPPEVVDLPKVQDKSSSDIVNNEEKEEPGANVHFVTEVAENVEIVSEKVEEKKPEIIDNPILSVVAHSSKGPTDAEEEPVTECVSVEKEPDKEPETDVPKEPVEPPKKEAQAIEVVPLEELIEGVAKENFERVEPPTEKEQPVELHPFKGLEEVIAKEISIPTEVPKEKQQGSEIEAIEAWQESREGIETKISESVEVSHESEFSVEDHLAKEQVVIEKEKNESFEPPKNKEQSDEVISQKESVEVTTKEVGASFGPPSNIEQADEGFSATKSEEVKEKETNDSTLSFEEVEKQEKEVIEVKDGIRELPEIAKHVQDTYAEAETVTDEKPLAPGDNTGPPIEGKIQKEEGCDKQNSACQMAESGPTKDSVMGSEKEQPATKFEETTCVIEEFVEPPKKEEQPIEVVPMKEPVQVVAKEDIEIVEPPIEKKQPVAVAKEISEDIEIVEPPIEKKQPVVVAKEINEVVPKEVTQKVEPPTEKQQSEVIAKEISEMVAKEVMEVFEPPTEKEQPVVTAKETSASIEPLNNKEQPNEAISRKESVEVIAQEVCASFDPPKNSEQADEGFLVSESGKRPDEDHPTKEFVSVNQELKEKPETTPVPELFVEPPKKEVHPIEVLTVEEQVEVITKEIIVTTEPPTEKEQPIEVHPLKESEEAIKIKITEPTELPKEKEDNDVHPVQESRDVTTDKISEISEIPKENELLTEVHLMKELEVISEGTSDSTEPPKNKDQPDEVLSNKEPLEVIEKETSASFEPPKNKEQADEGFSQTESLEVIAKEISASSEPPKNKEQADEGFLLTESGEMKGKETSDSTLGSEEVVKHDPQIIEEKDSVGELPELIKHVQNTYVEAKTMKDEKELALEDDINLPTKGGEVQEEEAQCVVESDEQVSVGQVAKSGLMDDSGKELEQEQPETTCVPELSIEPPKKEESVEVIPSKHVEVIEKKRVAAVELPTEKEEPNGSQVVEKEITETKDLPKEKEQAVEVQSVQESKEVIAENISESVEIPKESELLIEVQPVKGLEVMVKDTSESIKPPTNKEQKNEAPREKESEIIAKDISESFVPSKDMEQADEAFPVIGSEEMGAKEVSGSILGLEEIEKQEPKVPEVRDGKEELPEITKHVQNDHVEIETEPIVKGENVKDQKSLAIGDDSTPPLGVGKIHKEEEQCTVKSDKQDSVYQRGQSSVELAAPDFPHDAKEDEKKELSNIDMVAQLSVVEAPAMKKVGEENEEKGVGAEKADEDTRENIQKTTLPREEVAPRDYETDAVVAGKSIDDQKAGEVVDLIAETKVEESTTDEKLAPVETAIAEVNETPKEPQEFELEVKDEETVRARGEVPKVNDKKEVPSKPSHKHSHNILSKVKQSLVKAKKAIIGKSPSSKTLSSDARDDIKVK